MKKMILFLFAISITTAAIAQADLLPGITDKNPVRHGFSCPEGSVFSQVPAAYNTAFLCQNDKDFYLVATNFTATSPFSSFRFWGIDQLFIVGNPLDCILDATESFDVFIWDGDPADEGELIFSEELIGTTVETGEIYTATGVQIYQVDIDLGTVIDIESGYIGITRKNHPPCYGFFWIADGDGGGDRISFNDNGSIVRSEADLFF